MLTASWATVNVCPAIVNVPLRVAPGFGATCNVTAPFPLPVLPDPTEIQLASLAALHAHPSKPVTVTLCDPPAAETVAVEAESWNAQVAAACRTWKRMPFTSMSPCRGSGEPLAVT